MKQIACIVLHFRGLTNTKECVTSILSMKSEKLRIVPIVVDNGSDEPFVSENSEVIVIKNKENKGFTGGMNTGLTAALQKGYDYILIVNNDTTFAESFLLEAEKYLLSERKTGVFVPKIFFSPGTEFHHDRYTNKERGRVLWFAGGVIDWKNALPSHRGVDEVDSHQYDNDSQMDFATGCCMIFPRELLERVGLFDGRYYLYFEDIDLSLRIKKAGFDIVFMPKAHLWHKNAKSSGGPGSSLQDYYMTRNRLLFGMTYAPLRTKIALLREGMRLIASGREWQKKGVKDFLLGRFGKGSFSV